MELTPDLPPGYFWDLKLQLSDETARLTALVWPPFLSEESDLENPDLSFEMDADEVDRRFQNWGIRREFDGALVAHLSALLLHADVSANHFPDEGWQFAIKSIQSGAPLNCMCLLVANVDPSENGKGLAGLLIEKAKSSARALGLKVLIAPVRPTLKADFPEMPVSEYLEKRTPSGELFDPWLRAHVRAGGEVLNICRQSYVVRASLARWRYWTGVSFESPGEVLIPKGLVPLEIDPARTIGTYQEPGVWVRYRL